jgi:hypothetical protein
MLGKEKTALNRSKDCSSCKNQDRCLCQYDDLYAYLTDEHGKCSLFKSKF